VTPAGDGRWQAQVDLEWSTPRGPNGGYIAAIVLRALTAELDDPARLPRSLTLHYLRPPADGQLDVDVTVERTGRTLSTLSARLSQEGRPCVIALAAFAADFPSALDYAAQTPVVPTPEEIDPWPLAPPFPPIALQFEMRAALGPLPFSGADEALTGGWLRFIDPQQVDPVALAVCADAWLPSPFPRLNAPVGAPTVDLTIHFRAPEVVLEAGEHVLAVFRSRVSHGGFFEEDGELWAPDGTLLAQSRQLALLTPARRVAQGAAGSGDEGAGRGQDGAAWSGQDGAAAGISEAEA
jgi:acyl-CoA thioesterase